MPPRRHRRRRAPRGRPPHPPLGGALPRPPPRRLAQALFAIVQGGTDVELRGRCAEALVALDFPGYALGGFSVGETMERMGAAPGPPPPRFPGEQTRYVIW